MIASSHSTFTQPELHPFGSVISSTVTFIFRTLPADKKKKFNHIKNVGDCFNLCQTFYQLSGRPIIMAELSRVIQKAFQSLLGRPGDSYTNCLLCLHATAFPLVVSEISRTLLLSFLFHFRISLISGVIWLGHRYGFKCTMIPPSIIVRFCWNGHKASSLGLSRMAKAYL